MSERTQKLVALRSRTDHDLLVLVTRELDRAFALADVVASRYSPLFAQAVKAHSTATALLPRIAGLSQDDRLRIEGKAAELRVRLEQVPLWANVRKFRLRSHRNLRRPIADSTTPRKGLAHLRINLKMNLIKKPTPTALTDVKIQGGHEAKKLISRIF